MKIMHILLELTYKRVNDYVIRFTYVRFICARYRLMFYLVSKSIDLRNPVFS